jgi:hypothetical protein
MESKLFISPLPVVLLLMTFMGKEKDTTVQNEKSINKINRETVKSFAFYRFADDFGYHIYVYGAGYRSLIETDKKKPELKIGYVFDKEVQGSVALWRALRLIRGGGRDELYTTNYGEVIDAMTKYNFAFNYRPYAFIAPTQLPGTTPLYRILQTDLKVHGHFYTTSLEERNSLLADTVKHKDEGIAGYLWTTQVSLPAR